MYVEDVSLYFFSTSEFHKIPLEEAFLVLNGGNLSKHFQSVGVHYSNTSKSRTLLERLKEQRLGGLELDLSRFELRNFWGVVNLGSTSLLSHLPENLGHLARNLGGT